jgi:hypothetical protein
MRPRELKLKKIWICAAAIGAALVFSGPASAKNAKHGKHHGYGYSQGHAKYYKPMRSNRGGMMRGQDRARYVHGLNRAKRYGY